MLQRGCYGEREEFEIVLLVEPSALEALERQIHPSRYRERIDSELHMSVLFFSRVGLVIEDLQIPVAELQEIDMACNELAILSAKP
jgi:hypothetical protein